MQSALSQSDLIGFHTALKREGEVCEDAGLQAHYQHTLLSLEKLIESFGPTPEYGEWLGQSHPRDCAKHHTLIIDLYPR